ncbi:MAG: MFS transporter [Anaerolineae bacterium]|nr:MFS transporter [Anaerolineae bacterium]
MNRDLIFMALALFTWGVGEGAYYIFQPIYLKELGASPIEIGTILGTVGIAMGAAHIPAGYLSDRVGRRVMMWASWILGLLSAWLMALAGSLPIFVTGMVIYGITAFVMTPMNSYVTAASGKLSAGRALTMISAAYNLGAFTGPFIGGYIGDHFGLQKTYLFAASIFVVSNILIFNLRPQPVLPREPGTVKILLQNRAYWAYLGIILIVFFALYLPQPLTPNFMQDIHGLSYSAVGLAGSAGSLGNVVINLVFGSLNPHLGFLIGQITMALAAFVFWQATGLPWFMLAYFLMGGYRLARAMAIAQIRTVINPVNMGLAFGITETFSSFSLILVPPIAGIIYTWQPAAIYPIAILLTGFAILISVRFSPRPYHD